MALAHALSKGGAHLQSALSRWELQQKRLGISISELGISLGDRIMKLRRQCLTGMAKIFDTEHEIPHRRILAVERDMPRGRRQAGRIAIVLCDANLFRGQILAQPALSVREVNKSAAK